MSTEQIAIESPYLKRTVDISEGPYSREIFTKSPDDGFFKSHHHKNDFGIPFEAAIKINNEWIQIGIHEQKNVLWKEKTSTFDVTEVVESQGAYGPKWNLTCRSSAPECSGLEITICYEVSDKLPFLRKQVKVKNTSQTIIVIQNICVELFYSCRVGRNMQVMHDYHKNVSGDGRHFIGFHDYQFPEDIDIELAPEECMDSFNLYEIFVPEDEFGKAVWTGRVLKELAPWASRQDVTFQCYGISPNRETPGIMAFNQIIEQCRETGVETIMFFLDQIWTNIGDYVIRPDLSPNGEEDLKKLIQKIHNLGMRAGVYCSYSIAVHGSEIRENNLQLECIDKNGIKFDELQIDGPTDIPCYNNSHDHGTLGNYNYKSWLWEKSLFRLLDERSVTFTIPRDLNYILMGASKICGGYSEQDFCNDSGISLLANYRSGMYNQRKYSTPWATWGFLALDSYHGNSIGATEDTPEVFEQGIAALLGYGNSSFISGTTLYYGPITRKIIKKWITLFKNFKSSFAGDFIGLKYPDGKFPDAVLFTDYVNNAPSLVIILNPSADQQESSFVVPLKNSGFTNTKLVEALDLSTDKKKGHQYRHQPKHYSRHYPQTI